MQIGHGSYGMRFVRALLFVSLLSLVSALSKTDQILKDQERKLKEEEAERNLYHHSTINLKSYLKPDYLNSSSHVFPNPIIGYVTPWNNHGYDVAKLSARKYTHIAPVWLQFVPANKVEDGCIIEGAHDIDHNWIDNIREANPDIKITPRILLDRFSKAEFDSFLQSETKNINCMKKIAATYKKHGFDGLVLEFWGSGMQITEGRGYVYMVEMIMLWADYFHSQDLLIILPIPPPVYANSRPSNVFPTISYEKIMEKIDHLQIMTYDYPGGGAVAPFGWVSECLKYFLEHSSKYGHKILMGLNYYGYKYNKRKEATPVVKNDVIKLIQDDPQASVVWNEESQEHRIEFKNGYAYFPTLTSIKVRLELARKMGVGVAIWELGQGYDEFSVLL